MRTSVTFADRCEAGRHLSRALMQYQGSDTVVLGLARGGVPVAYEVAHALDTPLDVLVVRKLGAPQQPELAVGAVTSDVVILNREVIDLLRVSRLYIDDAIRRERMEVTRRAALFRGDRPPVEVLGRRVILIDDGIATGSTMLAAVKAVRQRGAREVVVATPVAAMQARENLERTADAFVCLATPEAFPAVGTFYDDFTQTTDEEVCRLLQRGQTKQTMSSR